MVLAGIQLSCTVNQPGLSLPGWIGHDHMAWGGWGTSGMGRVLAEGQLRMNTQARLAAIGMGVDVDAKMLPWSIVPFFIYIYLQVERSAEGAVAQQDVWSILCREMDESSY